MILKSDRIAERLSRTDSTDPFVVTPMPDLPGMRKSGGASMDLRLGCWFTELRQTRAALLDIRSSTDSQERGPNLMKMHFVRFGDHFILHPRSFVLGVTLEWIRLPYDLGGYVTSRSSWGRRGLVIATAVGVHPGFFGCLTLELSNVGELPIALYPGLAVCQLFLHHVDSASSTRDQSRFIGRRKPTLGEVSMDGFARRVSRDSTVPPATSTKSI